MTLSLALKNSKGGNLSIASHSTEDTIIISCSYLSMSAFLSSLDYVEWCFVARTLRWFRFGMRKVILSSKHVPLFVSICLEVETEPWWADATRKQIYFTFFLLKFQEKRNMKVTKWITDMWHYLSFAPALILFVFILNFHIRNVSLVPNSFVIFTKTARKNHFSKRSGLLLMMMDGRRIALW